MPDAFGQFERKIWLVLDKNMTSVRQPNLELIQQLRHEIHSNKKSVYRDIQTSIQLGNLSKKNKVNLKALYRKMDNLETSDDFLNRFLCITKGDVKKAFERYNKLFEGMVEIPGLDRIKNNDIDWLIEANNSINDSGFTDFYSALLNIH